MLRTVTLATALALLGRPAPADACTCGKDDLRLQNDSVVPPNARFYLQGDGVGPEGKVVLTDAKGKAVELRQTVVTQSGDTRHYEVVPAAALEPGEHVLQLIVPFATGDRLVQERRFKVAGKADKKAPPAPRLGAYRYTSQPMKTAKRGNVVVIAQDSCSTGDDRWLELQPLVGGKDKDAEPVIYAITVGGSATPIYRRADEQGWFSFGAQSTCDRHDVDLVAPRTLVKVVAIDAAGNQSPPLELTFETF